jgi:hypothetical protein
MQDDVADIVDAPNMMAIAMRERVHKFSLQSEGNNDKSLPVSSMIYARRALG